MGMYIKRLWWTYLQNEPKHKVVDKNFSQFYTSKWRIIACIVVPMQEFKFKLMNAKKGKNPLSTKTWNRKLAQLFRFI